MPGIQKTRSSSLNEGALHGLSHGYWIVRLRGRWQSRGWQLR